MIDDIGLEFGLRLVETADDKVALFAGAIVSGEELMTDAVSTSDVLEESTYETVLLGVGLGVGVGVGVGETVVQDSTGAEIQSPSAIRFQRKIKT